MDAYPNLKLIYTLLLSHTLLFLIARSFYPIVALQLSSMQDHMIWATNSAYTKPCIYLLEPGALNIPKICNHTQPINCHMIPEKGTMVSYMAQTPHHLNNQVLQYFLLLQLNQQRSTIQNLLISILHSMVGNCFRGISWLTSFFDLLSPDFPPFSTSQPIQSATKSSS